MRYILALLPPSEAAPSYIKASQELFSSVSDGYLLSEHASPHITICQFECKEVELKGIWEEVQDLRIHPFPVRFNEVSSHEGVEAHAGYHWVDISVAKEENLMKVHHAVVGILCSHGVASLTGIGDSYRPHLTFARMKEVPDVLDKCPEDILKDVGDFSIALGQGDDNGQYLYTINK